MCTLGKDEGGCPYKTGVSRGINIFCIIGGRGVCSIVLYDEFLIE